MEDIKVSFGYIKNNCKTIGELKEFIEALEDWTGRDLKEQIKINKLKGGKE